MEGGVIYTSSLRPFNIGNFLELGQRSGSAQAMRSILPLAAFLAASLVPGAHAQIRNLSSNSNGTCSIQGEGTWVRATSEGGSENVPIGTEEFPFTFSQSSLPPAPKSFTKVVPAPSATTYPGFTWAGGIQPAIDYQFTVPQWTTTLGANGELASAVIRYEVTSTVTTGSPHLASSSTGMVVFFETTEPMAISHSGGTFYDGIGTPLNPSQLLDSDGYLVAGNYTYAVIANPGSCSLALSLTPPPIDSDGDGLLDADEVSIYHTDPVKPDTDDDGLTDKEEVTDSHSDPLLPDSDGDGFLDGFEVKSGKSPTDAQSSPAAALTIHVAVELRVVTKLGTNYRVQSSPDMATWTDTDTLIEGTGAEVMRVFEPIEGGAKFWRVKAEE